MLDLKFKHWKGNVLILYQSMTYHHHNRLLSSNINIKIFTINACINSFLNLYLNTIHVYLHLTWILKQHSP